MPENAVPQSPELASAPQQTQQMLPAHRGKKILYLIGLLAALLLFSAVAYYFGVQSQQKAVPPLPPEASPLTQVPSRLAYGVIIDAEDGWKLYENKGIGYSFKYPTEFILLEEEILTLGNTNDNSSVTIDDRFIFPHRNLEEALKNAEEIYDIEERRTMSNGLLLIGKLKEGVPGGGETIRIAYITHPNGGILTVENSVFPLSTDIQIFDEILSTFQFVESENASLKTYTNTSYGYSINFPQTWKALNVAAGGENSEALPNSLIVDISDTTQAARPYPNGVVTIQGFDVMPSYNSGWTQVQPFLGEGGRFDGFKYETENGLDGLSVVYVIKNPKGGYIEVLFRSSKEDTIYKTFNEIISTFKFVN